MWFHCKCVLLTLIGRPIKWNAQQRAANATRWAEAVRAHGLPTLVACGCLAANSWFDPAVFVWILPVAIPLFLSIPLSVYSGSVSLGRASYRFGIFRIPEEESSPPELDDLRTVMEKQKQLKVTCRWISLPAERCGHAFNAEKSPSFKIASSVFLK